MSKYKEIVDDIQVQFKSHNESVKTQNPYWILFRFLSEMNSLRDELLQKITQRSDVPNWMIDISPVLNASLTNSGGVANVYDEHKFAVFTIPPAYYTTSGANVLEAISVMHQKTIYIETPESVMRKIRAEDDNLKVYTYGFVVDDKLYLYPFINQVYVYYIPKSFCGAYESVDVNTVIPAPDFIITEARKRVIESVMIQKQIPEDDRPDGKDQVVAQRN